MAGHLALSKSYLINVTTAGLHDSTSWKIPEYVAASRCIVSEPMVAETTAPLLDGTHYLSFSTPGQCVAACETLLVDTGRTRAMREENHRYYKAFVRPDRLMQRCLHTAVATHADHAATPID